MTTAAIGAQRAAVRVVLAVTVDAARRRVAILLSRQMARAAIRRCVLSAQCEIRRIVAKCRDVHPHDVDVATEMVGMARATLRTIDRRQSAVKSRFGTNIGGDVFMAVEAKCGLSLAIAAVVAVGASRLVFFVRFRQFARHEQRLDVRGIAAGSENRGDEHHDEQPNKHAPRPRALRPRSPT